jgi:uncharacterized membrane-anchored protein
MTVALALCLSLGTAAQAEKGASGTGQASKAKDAAAKDAASSKDPASAKTDEASTPAQVQTIVLGDKLAQVELSPEYRFVDQEKSRKFLNEQGDKAENVLGIIAPLKTSKDTYFIVCCFDDVGYIKDDDADKINADEILRAYKEGTEAGNEDRKERNIPPFYVGEWAEKPFYDKATHHVIWAIEIKEHDVKTAPAVSINYNTRILGRKGVLSMNLVCDPKTLDHDKVKVKEVLAKTSFIKGQTYAEYVPGHDKLAEYGLAGLILGGGAMAAAAKFGVFGVLWKWGLGILLVMKKFIIIAIAGLGALISKFFRKKPPGTGGGGVAGSDVIPNPTDELK